MREAVAVVLVHEDRLFALQRQPYLAAFPGFIAFPGGKIDREDEGHGYDHPLLSAFPGREIRALCRELAEEIDFDLERALAADEVAAIDLLGTAITPPFETARFRVPHYRITLKRQPELDPRSDEIAWSDWIKAAELWRRFEAGESLMVVPTQNIVRSLAADISVSRVEPFNLQYDPGQSLPYLELMRGIGMIPVPSVTLPPARFTNAIRIGDRGAPRLLVDPSPKSEETLALLLRTLAQRPVDQLLITHQHPDHHQLAPEIARRLQLPILCSDATERNLRNRFGRDYLRAIEVRHVAQGDVLTRWLGRAVVCHELPGHDDGMIGLAAEDAAWFHVSDLIQTQGSVVIPEPEGDMRAYLASLERVISQQPKVIIPAHGLPTASVWLLEQVLQHRLERERQIRALHNSGKTTDQIVADLYAGLDRKLLPLAQQNVRQHLRKLGLYSEQLP
ncbi:MAG: MBL fold metallo-hydrolase [Gammaproteobacteria bacterium]|nr:MBL fold metallo-hydrolase [Gammaproteobacteria bacterium]